MRKGFDGLCGLVQRELGARNPPVAQEVFIFLNRQRNRIKLLHWQGDGLAIYCKRLEKGTYEMPAMAAQNNSIKLTDRQLQFMLDGIVLSSVKNRPRYAQLLV